LKEKKKKPGEEILGKKSDRNCGLLEQKLLKEFNFLTES